MHISLADTRSMYKQAAESEEACLKLIKYCNDQTSTDKAIYLGYKGCATMMMARHLNNPYSKWTKFSAGRNETWKREIGS